MIRILNFRCVIEKHTTHEKYYPKVVSFSTVDSYPLTNPPSATIKIISASNLNDVATVSQVEYDDIIRLQASVKFYDQEPDVWTDLFEGRVENQSKTWSTNNDIEFSCKGHIQAAFKKSITADVTFTNQDASAILKSVTETNLTRIVYNASYVDIGPTVTEYNLKAKQNTVVNAYQEMEKVSGSKRIIDVVPVYSASGSLQTCYLKWKLFPTTATSRYSVIEGSTRLLSASFDVVGEDVANYRYVLGGTDASGNQYHGEASDADSVKEYGVINAVDTFTWIQSNSLCVAVAKGLNEDSGSPYTAGEVILEGTLDAHKGDLVKVYIPSLAAKGVEINGNYIVSRAAHSFNGNAWQTTLSLGKIKKSEYDYIGNLAQIAKTSYQNQAG